MVPKSVALHPACLAASAVGRGPPGNGDHAFRHTRTALRIAQRAHPKAPSESAWDPRRLHTLEVRMEHEYEAPCPEEVPARAS